LFKAIFVVALALAARAESTKQAALLIPHTHWEGAVFKTRAEYLDIGLPHITKALYLLKKHPEYRFVLDQMAYVRPYLERYPAEAAAFRKFVSEGRLQIAGGTNVMHDNNMPSGESIARQYLYSKRYFREALSADVTTGWGLDTFGHNAQMPQILKLAGMKSYWFQRGVPGVDTPAEFMWRGIDGTEIPAFWLPISYAPIHNVPRGPAEFARFLKGNFRRLDPFTKGPERVLMAGADVWEPEEHLPEMVAAFNRSDDPSLTARFALPADYERLVEKRGARPVISGELNPVFQGIYSSRIEVKQANRNAERLLTTAEKLAVLCALFETRGAGGSACPPPKSLERAWEPVLFNQAHDLASGVMVDKVYEDSMAQFDHSRRLAVELVDSLFRSVVSRADTQGPGVPILVVNALGWNRTDVVETDVAFSEPGVQSFSLRDAAGQDIPVQVIAAERNEDGSVRQARVVFIARDVPALGWAVYRAVPGPAAASQGGGRRSSGHEDQATLENEFYRASFNLWNGDLTSLVVKEGNWETLAAPGNVVAREHDGGDFWELYGTLNGGRLTAMTRPIPAPRPAYTQSSSDFVGGSGSASAGPVFSEFRIRHPLGKNQFATRVRMYAGLRRIDIATEIENHEELVRYRVLFPTSIRGGRSVHEIPFGAIERPDSAEMPAQNWVDYGDGKRGLALLNRGMPGNNTASGTMMLSAMRSARLISYGYIGGYEPGVGSDSGLGIGKRYTLEYALVPHAGDWRAAAVWRDGHEFNNPLIARMVDAHPGTLPSRWGLLENTPRNVVVSALKPGHDGGAVLRVYEAAGTVAKGVRIRLNAAIQEAAEVNLVEDTLAAVRPDGDALLFDLRPFEIKSFRLKLAAR
jgi:alpha-mannosidase